MQEYVTCPTTPEEWKELKTEFKQNWNIAHAVRVLDGKHVAIRKPKSGSLYNNYKGFFSFIMLALVDADCKSDEWISAVKAPVLMHRSSMKASSGTRRPHCLSRDLAH